MVQEGLEGHLMMAFERKICLSIDKEDLIDTLGRSSQELSKALLTEITSWKNEPISDTKHAARFLPSGSLALI